MERARGKGTEVEAEGKGEEGNRIYRVRVVSLALEE